MTEQDFTSKTKAWKAIFDKYNIYNHDFSLPYFISAKNIKFIFLFANGNHILIKR